MSLVFNNLMVKLTKAQVEAFLKEELEKANPGYVVSQVVPTVTVQFDFRGDVCGHSLAGFDIHLKRKGQ